MATGTNPPALQEKEEAWLKQFVGDPGVPTGNGPPADSVAGSQADWEATASRKAKLLDDMRKKLAARKDLIRTKMTFQLTLKNKKVVKSMDVYRNANKEFDIGHHLKELGATDEDKAQINVVIKQVNEGLDIVAELVAEIKNAPKVADAKPGPRSEATDKKALAENYLFADDRELMEEFYTPLVREGIIPENAVTKRFSEFQQSFDGSVALYEQKLKTLDAKAVDKKEKLEKIGQLKSLAGVVTTITNTANKLAGGPEMVETVTNAAYIIATASLTIASGVINRSVDDVVDGIGTILAAVVSEINPDLGTNVYYIYTGATKSAEAGIHFGKAIANKDVAEFEAGVKCLGAGFVGAFGFVSNQGALGDSAKNTFSSFGTTMNLAFTTNASATGAYKALVKGDYTAFASQLTAAASTAVAGIRAYEFAAGKEAEEAKKKEYEKYAEEEKGKAKEGYQATVEEIRKKAEEDGVKPVIPPYKEPVLIKESDFSISSHTANELYKKGVVESVEDAEKMVAANEQYAKRYNFKEFEELLKSPKAASALKAQSGDVMNAKVEEEQKKFRALLAMGGDGDEGDEEIAEFRDSQSIERLIAEARTDGALLSMAAMMVKGGVSLAGQFVPACKAATAGIVMVEKMVSACRRSLELIEWADNIDDARVAGSPVHEALKKHAHELKKQISRDTILAFLAMAEMVGAAVACAGVDMGAGQAVQKLAAASAAGTQLAYEGITEAELRFAWKAYKKALANPDDRIEARKALRKNPTLALYSLSFNAKAKDPVALNVMMKMSLTEVTVDDADPHKIVEFLEARFSEDPKLYKPRVEEIKWAPPGGAALTLSSWMNAKKGALDKGKLAPIPATTAIDSGMAKVESAALACKAKDVDLKTVERYLSALKHLKTALGGYEPLREKEKKEAPRKHEEMTRYLWALSDMVDEQNSSASNQRETLVKDQATNSK